MTVFMLVFRQYAPARLKTGASLVLPIALFTNRKKAAAAAGKQLQSAEGYYAVEPWGVSE